MPAAVHIQAQLRGYLLRRRLRRLECACFSLATSPVPCTCFTQCTLCAQGRRAARLIQRCWRGFLGREHFKETLDVRDRGLREVRRLRSLAYIVR